MSRPVLVIVGLTVLLVAALIAGRRLSAKASAWPGGTT